MPEFQNRGGSRGPRRGMGDPNDPESEQYRKLFIGGLSYETDEDGLKSHFEQWGEIVDCVVMRDPNTRRSRGFGFITYKESAMIDQSQAHRPHKLDGREVEAKRAMPREESGRSESQQSVKKMFIGGLPQDTTEDQIQETFADYGNIESVDLIKDKATGRNKGFCFVTFDDHDCVDKAVLKKKFNINGKMVEVKKAIPKDQQGGGGGGGARGGRGGGRGGGAREGGYSGGGGYGGGGYGAQAGGYGAQAGGYGGQGGYGGGGGYNQGGYGDTSGYGGGGGWGGSSSFGSNYGGYGSGGGGYGAGAGGGYGGGASGGYGGGASGYGGGYKR